MQQIKKLYRRDYQGENIIRDLVWQSGQWNTTPEYVPNAVTNLQISNRAVVIGNGISRQDLYPDLFSLLANHRAGLFGVNAVQTYGCNALYRDFTPDFLVCVGPTMANEIAQSGYSDNQIVYSTQDSVLNYPGKFYLTPQNPHWDSGAIAAYLACFDGHKTVYLMGYDGYSGEDNSWYNVYAGTPGYPSHMDPNTEAFTILSLKLVMDTYSDVDFVRVMPTRTYYMPDIWKYQLNLRQIDWRDFVVEVDI